MPCELTKQERIEHEVCEKKMAKAKWCEECTYWHGPSQIWGRRRMPWDKLEQESYDGITLIDLSSAIVEPMRFNKTKQPD